MSPEAIVSLSGGIDNPPPSAQAELINGEINGVQGEAELLRARISQTKSASSIFLVLHPPIQLFA